MRKEEEPTHLGILSSIFFHFLSDLVFLFCINKSLMTMRRLNHSLLRAQRSNTLYLMILTIYLMLFGYYCFFSVLNIMFMI